MMATTIYTSQTGVYGYPQPPPSPPVEDTPKCSLPSISNLIVVADAGSPTTEQSPQSQLLGSPKVKVEARPESAQANNAPSRNALPPTPPMGAADAKLESYNSPATKALSHVPASGPNYYYETTPPVEDVSRQTMTGTPIARLPVQASAYAHAQLATPYMNQPPMGSYYQPPMSSVSPVQPQISALYYQRPLPQTFASPAAMSVSLAAAPAASAAAAASSAGTGPWQHHHYISPSSAASFPQSQDRYVCQTCNKAFSRPSSLRIHSHSHTGEKPFKCPYAGCGKAFSVRSNMKRHERGCHDEKSGSGNNNHSGIGHHSQHPHQQHHFHHARPMFR